MWLLAFAVLALIVGADLRARGHELCCVGIYDGITRQIAQDANALGAWIGVTGGLCLNIAVWQLF
jgi:hypothetical protein